MVRSFWDRMFIAHPYLETFDSKGIIPLVKMLAPNEGVSQFQSS